MCIKFFEMGTDLFVFGLGTYSLVENWCEIPQPITKRSNRNRVVTLTVASFRFEDDDENEDQVELLLIVRMLKSVTVMA